MAITSRLTNTGILLVNGALDEASLPAGAISFNGTSQYLSTPVTIPINTLFDLVATDFTIEGWFYNAGAGAERYIVSQRGAGSGWEFRINATNLLQFFYTGGSQLISTGTVPANTWTYIAVTRSGATVRIFINGALDSSTTFSNGSSAASVYPLYIGWGTTGGGYFSGYISNLRIIKGTAVYTAAFTPPQSILPSITNTQLLLNVTDSANFIKDNSPNNLTLTNNGTATWTATGPFNRGSTTLKQRQLSDGTLEVLTQFDEVTYNPASTTANGGRYNLSSYSNYFAFDGTLGWNNIFTAGATLTTGVAAPDSSSTAVRFSCNNTTNALLRVYLTSFTPNGSSTYTMSFYARHVSGTKTGCISDLADGVSFDYSSTLVTGSWVRITYSGIPTATGKSFIDLFSDANTNNVIEYWGVQIQQASSVSIYQPIYNNLVTPPFTRREGSTGTLYVNNQFDEFTGAPVVDSSLQLWVDAGQTASYPGSGTTWTDLSATPKNYTLTASPTFNSITGGGVITFTGASSQYASSASTLFNSTTYNTYTINLWVYPTGAGQLVAVDGQATINSGYHYSAIEISAAGVIKFGQWTGGMTTIATSTQSLNSWYNLVITYNGTTATAYVNNTNVGSSAIAWSSPGANTFFPLMGIDTTNMGTTGYASGSVGAFMVYNRGLAPGEVTTNFNALRGRYGV